MGKGLRCVRTIRPNGSIGTRRELRSKESEKEGKIVNQIGGTGVHLVLVYQGNVYVSMLGFELN